MTLTVTVIVLTLVVGTRAAGNDPAGREDVDQLEASSVKVWNDLFGRIKSIGDAFTTCNPEDKPSEQDDRVCTFGDIQNESHVNLTAILEASRLQAEQFAELQKNMDALVEAAAKYASCMCLLCGRFEAQPKRPIEVGPLLWVLGLFGAACWTMDQYDRRRRIVAPQPQQPPPAPEPPAVHAGREHAGDGGNNDPRSEACAAAPAA